MLSRQRGGNFYGLNVGIRLEVVALTQLNSRKTELLHCFFLGDRHQRDGDFADLVSRFEPVDTPFKGNRSGRPCV